MLYFIWLPVWIDLVVHLIIDPEGRPVCNVCQEPQCSQDLYQSSLPRNPHFESTSVVQHSPIIKKQYLGTKEVLCSHYQWLLSTIAALPRWKPTTTLNFNCQLPPLTGCIDAYTSHIWDMHLDLTFFRETSTIFISL